MNEPGWDAGGIGNGKSGPIGGKGFDGAVDGRASIVEDDRLPHGHRKTTTLVAGLRSTGMVAPLVIDGPINGEWFEAYVAQVLVPTLKPGDVVTLDNLSSHKRPAARVMIEAAGASMLFLPPYSPDFNPIRKAFSKLNALLSKAAERTVTGLWDRIVKLIDLIEPQDARNFFNSCGYDPI